VNKKELGKQLLLELFRLIVLLVSIVALAVALYMIGNAIVGTPSTHVVLEATPVTPAPYPKDIVLAPAVLRATTVIIKKETPPKPVVTAVARKATARESRGLTEDDSRAIMDGFQVTWYNNYYDGTDKTASCTTTTAGRTMAVDPRVIPIGTWVEMTFPNGDVYIRKAEDTGSKVKGKIIDIYSDASTSALMQRGRTHNVTVKILKKE
jgi:3D (Asp-Asp-Asp) domain-containing protein